MLFIVSSQWSYFGRSPIKRSLCPPPPHTHTRMVLPAGVGGRECITLLTSFGSPENRPLACRFCGKKGLNYVSNLKTWFYIDTSQNRKFRVYFFSGLPKKSPFAPHPPPRRRRPHGWCLPAGRAAGREGGGVPQCGGGVWRQCVTVATVYIGTYRGNSAPPINRMVLRGGVSCWCGGEGGLAASRLTAW